MSAQSVSADALQQHVENQLSSSAMEDIKKSTDEIYAALVEDSQRELAQLPEAIFVSYFLPFFSGQQVIDKSQDVIAQWISVAGSPMAEVSIIDPAGKVLFIVPALFDSSIINSVDHAVGDSLSDIFSQYKIRARNVPAQGELYLKQAMDSKVPEMTRQSQQYNANTERWQTIFQRYQIVPVSVQQTASVAGNADDLDYE